jgi:hypothetical protein
VSIICGAIEPAKMREPLQTTDALQTVDGGWSGFMCHRAVSTSISRAMRGAVLVLSPVDDDALKRIMA